MERLELAWASEKSAVAPRLDTSLSTEDRGSKLRLLKGKLRRRSSEEAASDGGTESQADSYVRSKAREEVTSSKPRLSRGSEKLQNGVPPQTRLSSGLEGGAAVRGEQGVSSTLLRQPAGTVSGPRLLTGQNKTTRRSGSEFGPKGRRFSEDATNSKRNLKPGAQPVPRESSSPSTSLVSRDTVKREPFTRKQPVMHDFRAKKGASSGVSAEASEQSSGGTPDDDEPSTSGASLRPGPHSHHRIDPHDQRWEKGPLDEAGRVTKVSEQPVSSQRLDRCPPFSYVCKLFQKLRLGRFGFKAKRVRRALLPALSATLVRNNVVVPFFAIEPAYNSTCGEERIRPC